MARGIKEARSLLFVPGFDERKLAKALDGDADGIIADLEDAVAPQSKDCARVIVDRAFAASGSEQRLLVRVNGADTPYFEGDLALVRRLNVAAIVLPKASRSSVAKVGEGAPPIIALIETALGLQDSNAIALSPGVTALALGAIDLGVDLGLIARADGLELLFARSKLVMDSAAAGLRPPFDSVHANLRDTEGLQAEAVLGRSLGMGGKFCIHPAQVATVNLAFSPKREEVDEAKRVIAAYETAVNAGIGAVALEGQMIDKAVVARARRLLAMAGQDLG